MRKFFSQTSANLWKPRQTSENLEKSRANLCKTISQTSANLRKSRKNVIGLWRFFEVFLGFRRFVGSFSRFGEVCRGLWRFVEVCRGCRRFVEVFFCSFVIYTLFLTKKNAGSPLEPSAFFFLRVFILGAF